MNKVHFLAVVVREEKRTVTIFLLAIKVVSVLAV